MDHSFFVNNGAGAVETRLLKNNKVPAKGWDRTTLALIQCQVIMGVFMARTPTLDQFGRLWRMMISGRHVLRSLAVLQVIYPSAEDPRIQADAIAGGYLDGWRFIGLGGECSPDDEHGPSTDSRYSATSLPLDGQTAKDERNSFQDGLFNNPDFLAWHGCQSWADAAWYGYTRTISYVEYTDQTASAQPGGLAEGMKAGSRNWRWVIVVKEGTNGTSWKDLDCVERDFSDDDAAAIQAIWQTQIQDAVTILTRLTFAGCLRIDLIPGVDRKVEDLFIRWVTESTMMKWPVFADEGFVPTSFDEAVQVRDGKWYIATAREIEAQRRITGRRAAWLNKMARKLNGTEVRVWDLVRLITDAKYSRVTQEVEILLDKLSYMAEVFWGVEGAALLRPEAELDAMVSRKEAVYQQYLEEAETTKTALAEALEKVREYLTKDGKVPNKKRAQGWVERQWDAKGKTPKAWKAYTRAEDAHVRAQVNLDMARRERSYARTQAKRLKELIRNAGSYEAALNVEYLHETSPRSLYNYHAIGRVLLACEEYTGIEPFEGFRLPRGTTFQILTRFWNGILAKSNLHYLSQFWLKDYLEKTTQEALRGWVQIPGLPAWDAVTSRVPRLLCVEATHAPDVAKFARDKGAYAMLIGSVARPGRWYVQLGRKPGETDWDALERYSFFHVALGAAWRLCERIWRGECVGEGDITGKALSDGFNHDLFAVDVHTHVNDPVFTPANANLVVHSLLVGGSQKVDKPVLQRSQLPYAEVLVPLVQVFASIWLRVSADTDASDFNLDAVNAEMQDLLRDILQARSDMELEAAREALKAKLAELVTQASAVPIAGYQPVEEEEEAPADSPDSADPDEDEDEDGEDEADVTEDEDGDEEDADENEDEDGDEAAITLQ